MIELICTSFKVLGDDSMHVSSIGFVLFAIGNPIFDMSLFVAVYQCEVQPCVETTPDDTFYISHYL